MKVTTQAGFPFFVSESWQAAGLDAALYHLRGQLRAMAAVWPEAESYVIVDTRTHLVMRADSKRGAAKQKAEEK